MARNRSTNRRRRRGRFSFLMKLLCILLIAGAVVAALTVFFKVQSITVSGNARYTSEEIIAASGIEIEDNLFLLNKYMWWAVSSRTPAAELRPPAATLPAGRIWWSCAPTA